MSLQNKVSGPCVLKVSVSACCCAHAPATPTATITAAGSTVPLSGFRELRRCSQRAVYVYYSDQVLEKNAGSLVAKSSASLRDRQRKEIYCIRCLSLPKQVITGTVVSPT